MSESIQYPTLKNPPITEALIDFRVKLPETIDALKIDSIYESIKEQYPEKQEQRKSEIRFDAQADEQVKVSGNRIYGYRYIASDERQILQARLDGFTFSRLTPYSTWAKLHNEAHRLWSIYEEATSPELITRVALRYINNLNIPMPIKDFGEYLSAPPKVPEGLPQGIAGFLTRIVIHESSIGATAIITHALESAVTYKAPIILDIDVFKLHPEGIDKEDAWEIIQQLRDFKNKIFFDSITETLKEVYR